ncbi:hypothetical protein PISL3812_08061 [Talaromyces islandicus]|uniref:Major facilitator superfamily (MFS) profile domain-containing protein n=1 Tax=Talaromyces islandicus TaxID=28573 RepID=A0A0U1M5Y2_TALIS|nr:hypothetical protein PISL3812_08061 [Talaromyces islandicus]
MPRKISFLVSGYNSLEFRLATFVPIPLIDRVVRPIMLFSAIGQTIPMAILAGCDGIPFLLPVELTPLRTRGKSVAIATGCFGLCNFFVVMISPVLIDSIKYVPESSKAVIEVIDILFETSPTMLIRPGSRKKLQNIVSSRQTAECVRINEKGKDNMENMTEVEYVDSSSIHAARL